MPLTSDTKKLMFEIYREADFSGRYRVVYFTELGEHDKEVEIADAMRGEHIFDGFLLHRERSEAKQAVNGILERREGYIFFLSLLRLFLLLAGNSSAAWW